MLTPTENNGMHRCDPALATRQSGFSLLEVLIAVFVLAIGLLGLAGLQAYSLQNNQSSMNTSQATFLAQDIIDAMRANQDNLNDYDIEIAEEPPEGDSVQAQDLREWKTNLDGLLPGVADDDALGGAIAVNGDEVTITIRWLDARWDEDDPDVDETRQFQTTTRVR